MIIQWMSFLGPRLLWCTVQVAIFAVVAAFLCMRPWSPKSPSVPLLGLVAIFVLTVESSYPFQGGPTTRWIGRRAWHCQGISQRFDSSSLSGNKAIGDSNLGPAYDPNAKRTEVASLRLFSEGWRSWIPAGTEPARELERIESSETCDSDRPRAIFSGFGLPMRFRFLFCRSDSFASRWGFWESEN